MRRFSEVIEELSLKDLPSSGGQFTWYGGPNSQAASRLDHFLISNEWEDHFLGVFQCALPRIVSDHCPISLEGREVKKGKSPFCFENMWLLSDGFKELVKVWWTGYSVAGSNNHCLAEKLKALKRDLRRWNKEVFERSRSLEEPFSDKRSVRSPVQLLRRYLVRMASPWHFGIFPGILPKLKLVVGEVVSKYQHAFIQNRQILDAALIANEAVDFRLKDNLSGLLLKLDIEKALIMSTGTAFCHHGDSQPVALQSQNGGFIEGFKVGSSSGVGRDLLHLLFADDTLLLCKANSEQLRYLSWVFLWFEVISRLKVNRDKSEAIPEDAYLDKEHSFKSFNLLYVSLCHFAESVYKICKYPRDFLWGGGALEKKMQLVNWSVVCADMRQGGLGIRSLVALNKALLGKWSWKFVVERDSLWKQVIIDKFGVEEGGWCSREVKEAYGVGDQWVFDAWEEDREVGSWNPLFSRHFNDWEMEEVEGLLRKLHPLVLNRDVEDVLSWKSWAPMRVSFFAWEASWNRILTIEQLKRRDWNMPNRCYLLGPAFLNQKEFDRLAWCF
ncbi:putative ribonuclease H protein [Vitis vinifera]|uniref:Putative ribonuclease H protein n=1 Tax=Vitis vinifera TaxID=29760 RepID=A0A438DSN8_VITVI|nr:putative ribonuclease H protein [Vitis vinifera]